MFARIYKHTDLDMLLDFELDEQDAIDSKCKKQIPRILLAFSEVDISANEFVPESLHCCGVSAGEMQAMKRNVPSRC